MLRKSLQGAGILAMIMAAGGLFCFGTDSVSYVTTGVSCVTQSARDAVPVGFEIERARKMIGDLTPDIRQNMHVIAEEEVQIKRLDERIARTEADLQKQKESIMTLKNDLSSDRDSYTYRGKVYTVSQVKADLSCRFERFKTQDATLASLKQTLAARQQGLSAAKSKLDGMVAAKRQLEVDVENLEAQLKLVEAAQTTANYNFDDSRLGRAKELVQNLRTKLDVTQSLLGQEAKLGGAIELEHEAPTDIAQQVTEYFSTPAKPQVAQHEPKIELE
jgi:chromosome segregation ATPase